MKIIQLKYFKAVCDFNNISKAAMKFGVSQPAISTAIKELEAEFNTLLFIRNNNKLVLTEAGEYFKSLSDNLLEQFDDLETAMMDYSRNKKNLSIGVPHVIGTFFFPNLLRAFNEEYPDIEFSIIETGSLKVSNLLDNKKIDLGFISCYDQIDNNYEFIDLKHSEFVYCVNKNHILADRKTIDIRDLDNESIILYSKSSLQNKLFTDKFKELNINPKIYLNSSQLSTITEFLKNNRIGAVLHKDLFENSDDIICIPFTEPILIKIGIIYKKNSKLSKVSREFIDCCKKVCGK